jgi:hypothetical protein
MDMPPSGWYPDPYGVRSLLRWWDGSGWTEHTQSQDAALGDQTALDIQPPAAAAERTSLDIPPATSMDIPPAVERTTMDMPAVPAAPAVPAVPGPSRNVPGNATQMFSPEDYTGYARAQRRRRIRRRWIMAALAAGTAVILVVIVLALVRFGKQPTKPVSLETRPSATPSASKASASPSPSPSASSTFTAQIADSSSGLTYGQLASPWQATCPGALNQQGFGWTAGESAVAGTVNGQPWYGNACSGLLPAQYGYTSTADLSSTASTLAGTFENTFYNGMQHTVSQLADGPLQVSGAASWEVTFLITYTDPTSVGATWTTEEGEVVVVDRGAGNQPAVFYVSVPANLGTGDVSTLATSLTLTAASGTATPSASTSTTATTSASVSATQGNGKGNGPGNGNGNPGGPGGPGGNP